MKVIIAEKPNLGRTIASALGVYDKYDGYLSNGEITVTYAFGHLLELKDMDAYFGHKVPWGENLPFYPDPFEFDLKKDVKKQFDIICNLINSSETDEIICAGDADREGEVIVRLILSAGLRSYKKITRLWLPDQTPQTITKQMEERKSDSEYDNLYYEGLARTYIDWILGINLTRSISSIANQMMSIGRVICPIVIAIYERDKSIDEFVPQKYYSLVSNVDGIELVSKLKFDINERSDALSVCDDYNTSGGTVVDVSSKDTVKNSPRLFSLSKLQGYCGKKFKLKPAETLSIVQSLYEMGLVTYPRTNTEFLSENEKDKVKNLIQIHDMNGELIYKDTKRVFDDSKIESHSALSPTEKIADISSLSEKEANVYTTIYNRFFSVFTKEECVVTESVIDIQVGRYKPESIQLKGKMFKSLGWMKYEMDDAKNVSLPDLKIGEQISVDFKPVEKKTSPPSHYTVETLGNYLTHPFKKENDSLDDEYKSLLDGCEIGTEATRAGIIEKAINIGYISLKRNVYRIEPKGKYMVESLQKVHCDMSPARTVEMQKTLKSVYKGNLSIDDALIETKSFLNDYFSNLSNYSLSQYDKSSEWTEYGSCPWCGKPIYKLKGKNGDFYSHKKDDRAQCSFALQKKANVFGNEIELSEKDIKSLLNGKCPKFTLYSKGKDKNYEAGIKIKNKPRSFNNKDYIDWELVFSKKKKRK